MSGSLIGIDTTPSISRHTSATSSNTCALRTTRAGCCAGTISLFTDGCVVQTPSAPLVHCPVGSVVVPRPPFGRSAFVVALPVAATPAFATEAVPSVALVASSVAAVVPGWDDFP